MLRGLNFLFYHYKPLKRQELERTGICLLTELKSISDPEKAEMAA